MVIMAENPEQEARGEIDSQLAAASWLVQSEEVAEGIEYVLDVLETQSIL